MPEQRLSLVSSLLTPRAADARLGPFSLSSIWAVARRWRPEMSHEGLLLGLGLYFTLACNTPFWRALLASRGSEGGALAYLLALGVALTALNFLLFAPLLGRWMTKPLLGGLIGDYFTLDFAYRVMAVVVLPALFLHAGLHLRIRGKTRETLG